MSFDFDALKMAIRRSGRLRCHWQLQWLDMKGLVTLSQSQELKSVKWPSASLLDLENHRRARQRVGKGGLEKYFQLCGGCMKGQWAMVRPDMSMTVITSGMKHACETGDGTHSSES
eukprot:scaffold46916_cov55-Attheya_sp.AAC.5